jgi:hypothetical protein
MLRVCSGLASFLFSAALLAVGSVAAEPEPLTGKLVDRVVVVSQDWGQLGLNTGVKPASGKTFPLRIGDKTYASGLGTHANSRIAVDLDGEFDRFDAEIGVLWQGGTSESASKASVVFEVIVDGESKFKSSVIHESDPAQKISIPVREAGELILAVSDAGDGIMFDAACWSDARLIRSAARPAVSLESSVVPDIAPFAAVSTWEPKRMEGTKADRIQEFPAADVRLGKAVVRAADGTYAIAAWPDGAGAIGLEWRELRCPREVAIQWAGNAPGDAQLQLWQGESTWQGKWIPSASAAVKQGKLWTWAIPRKELGNGICKLRWVVPHVNAPLAVERIAAVSRDRWIVRGLRVEPIDLNAAPKTRITAYNARLLGDGEKPIPAFSGPLDRAWTFQVASSKGNRDLREQAMLRFEVGDKAFGVGIKDVVVDGCVYIPHAGIAVSLDPPKTPVKEFVAKLAGKKTVLQEVNEKPDQTLAQAMEKVHNPIQDNCPTLASLAADNRKYIIGRQGQIAFFPYDSPHAQHPEWNVFLSEVQSMCSAAYYRIMPEFGNGPSTGFSRSLVRDWYPAPMATTTVGPVAYRVTTGVVPLAVKPRQNADDWMPIEAALVADYVLENTQDAPAPARLKLALANDPAASKPIELKAVKEGAIGGVGDRLVVLADATGLAGAKLAVESNALVVSGTLGPKQKVLLRLVLPSWPVKSQDYAKLLHRGDWIHDLIAYWNDVLEPASQIDTPDAFYNNVVRASCVHCLLAARNEAEGKRISAWIGADRYGPLESEAHAVIRGMDLLGHEQFATRSLEFFLNRINSNGALNTGYTLLGTGVHAWVLADHYDRTADKAWASRVAPKVAAMCDWIAAQCKKTVGSDAAGSPFPESGLFTPGVYADWNRYAFRFVAQGVYYAGLSNGARLLQDANHPKAAGASEAAKRLYDAAVRAYHWTQARSPVAKLRNGTYIPRTPSWCGAFGDVGDLYLGEDGGRAYAYDTECGPQNMVAGGILDPLSQEVGWMLDRLEDVQFLVAGWQDYPLEKVQADPYNLGGFAKIQPYYARAIEMHAARDNVKPYIRDYFNAMSTLLSRENLSFWEHFHNTAGWNKTHETGWFLCQTRFLFAMERGNELWLAPFVTNRWLADGQKVSARNLPTRFGKTGFELISHIGAGAIEATVWPPDRNPPKQIVLRVRHPEGKAMKRVSVDGRNHTEFDASKDIVRISPQGKPIAIRVEY